LRAGVNQKSLTHSLAYNVKRFAYCKTKWQADHLEDGKCANVNEEIEMYNKCKSVPKCNRLAENIFGYTDGLTKCRPHISTLACEACTILANKNGE